MLNINYTMGEVNNFIKYYSLSQVGQNKTKNNLFNHDLDGVPWDPLISDSEFMFLTNNKINV